MSNNPETHIIYAHLSSERHNPEAKLIRDEVNRRVFEKERGLQYHTSDDPSRILEALKNWNGADKSKGVIIADGFLGGGFEFYKEYLQLSPEVRERVHFIFHTG